MSNWTILSNHGHVLVCLSRDPASRLRDVALEVGITERAVQKIVRDLQDADMLKVAKKGRRNSYRVIGKQPLRHELEADTSVGELLGLLVRGPQAKAEATVAPAPTEPVVAGRRPSAPAAGAADEAPAADVRRQQGTLF